MSAEFASKWIKSSFQIEKTHNRTCKYFGVTNGYNQHEFIVLTVDEDMHDRHHFNFYRFDARNHHNKLLEKVYSLTKSVPPFAAYHWVSYQMVFDKTCNKLYLFNKQWSQLIVVCLESKRHDIINIVQSKDLLLVINGKIYLLSNFGDHVTGRIENTQFIVEQNIKNKGIFGAIHISSKQCLLTANVHSDMSIVDDKDMSPSQSWVYCNYLGVSNINEVSVKTSNERYLIIFNKDISVLDMRNWTQIFKLKKCKIPCPSTGRCKQVLRTGGVDSKDEQLVFGFIRNCFKQKEFAHIQMLPVYLMKMIEEKYETETLHWIGDGNQHWAIYLKDILNNLY